MYLVSCQLLGGRCGVQLARASDVGRIKRREEQLDCGNSPSGGGRELQTAFI